MSHADAAQVSTPVVYQARQAAEQLTGCRVQAPEADQVNAYIPLPHDVTPSLSHVAVAVDAVAGQAAATHLPDRSTAIRTLSLNAQLTAPLTAGSWVRAVGRVRARQGRSIVATAEVFDAAQTLVALGTCRFIVVDQPRSTSADLASETLSQVRVPGSWDHALGLGEPTTETSKGSPTPVTMRSVTPQATTDNAASMVHGGVLVRALELGMHSALELQDADPQTVLNDVAVVYHRPVPLGAGADVQSQSTLRRRGRTVSVATAALVGPQQRLLTTAEGVFGAFGA